MENDIQILIIKEVAENDGSVLEILQEKCPGLVDENGNIPISVAAWGVEIDAYNSTLRDAWDVVSENGSMPDGKSPEDILDDYATPYREARNKAN